MKSALFVAIDAISAVTYEALGISLVRGGLIRNYTIIESDSLNGGWRQVLREMLGSFDLTKEIAGASRKLGMGCIRYLAGRDYAFEEFAMARIYGIEIGDSILGCSLRSNSENRISFCKNVAWVFKEAIKTAVACKASIALDKYDYVGVWEQNYLLRHLCRRICITTGVSLIQFNNYPDKLRFYSSGGELTYEKELKAGRYLAYTERELLDADSFMSKRTQDISKIGYMDRVQDEESERFQLLGGLDDELVFSDKIYRWKENQQDLVVIYSHSYSDAQLTRGWDGFLGCYEWQVKAIEFALQYNLKIIIKPHPSWKFMLEDEKHPTSKLDLMYLKAIVSKLSRYRNDITYCPLGMSVRELLEKIGPEPRCLHISHHGSVIPELAFLGKVNVSSSVSPWADWKSISNIFHNPKQLLDIIIRYATRGGSLVMPDRRETLEFVRSYYIERCGELSCEKYETALSSFCKALRSADRSLAAFSDNQLRFKFGSVSLLRLVERERNRLIDSMVEDFDSLVDVIHAR